MKALLLVAAAVVTVYLALALYLFVFQARFLFFPQRMSEQTMPVPTGLRDGFRGLYFQAADGTRLHGWFAPALPGRAVFLYMHGNAGSIAGRVDTLRFLHDLGYGVFLFDYRGYGLSDGSPDEQGTYRDARAAWDTLTGELGVDPGAVVLYGRSLGAAIAAELATKVTVAGVVVDSAFTSVPDVAAEIYPFLPVRSLSRFRYPTREYLALLRAPVLIVHSRQDEVIPYRHSERLLEVAQPGGKFIAVAGGHNESLAWRGEDFRRALMDFADAAAATRSPVPESGERARREGLVTQ